METKKCQYCGRTYRVETYHRTEGLTRYCSHGCRLAVELTDLDKESHSGAVHLVINDPTDPAASEVYSNTSGHSRLKITHDPMMERAPGDNNSETRLIHYLERSVNMLLNLSQANREIVLRRMRGENWKEVAVQAGVMIRRKVTENSAQKAVSSALIENPFLIPYMKHMAEKSKKLQAIKEKHERK